MVTASTLNAAPGQGVTIGFNIGNNNTLYAYWSNLFADMRTLGITWVRLNYSWSNIERTQGTYTWTVLDDAVQQINAAGFNLLFCLRGAPTWALTNTAMQGTSEPWFLPDTTLMAGFATAVVTRYNGSTHGRIDAIGYNEDFNINHCSTTDTLALNQTMSHAGGPYTSFTITASQYTPQAGTKIYFGGYGNTTDVATINTNVSVGDTTVHINSFTPAVTYSAGNTLNLGYIAVGNNSPYSLYNPGAGGVTTANGHKSNPSRDGYYASQVMLAVTPAIRAVNSTIPIGTPCIWWIQPQNTTNYPGSPSNMTAYLTQIYQTAGSVIDAHTFIDGHYYSNATDPAVGNGQTSTIAQWVADVNNVSKAFSDTGRQLWVTEFGWQVPIDCSETQQNTNYSTVLNAVIPGNNPSKNKIFFFTLYYQTTGGTGSSLIYWNGSGYSYRAAFTTLQNYIATHAGGGGGGGGGGGTANQVLIRGSSYFVEAGSLLVDSAIGRRSTASTVVHTQNTTTHFQQDQQVAIYDGNSNLAFSGYVATPKESKPGFQSSLEHTLQFVDQHRLADKRVVAATFTGKSSSFMVQYLYTNILANEGVTIGQIFDGPLPSTTLYPGTALYPNGSDSIVPSAVFAYCTVAQALDAIVKNTTSGGIPYYWQIDQNLKLWVVPYTAITNSTVVDGTLVDDGRLSGQAPIVTRANPAYTNTQYVTGGVSQTIPQYKVIYGDSAGNITTYTMDYEVQSIQHIWVNNTLKTFGVKGVSTGKDFYYAVGDPIIAQDPAGTRLLATDQFRCAFIGQYPSVFVSQNAAQVAFVQTLDNSTGIVESVVADSTITTSAAGLARASNLLQRYSTQGIMCQFNTRASGYAPGQMITVNLPMHGLNNTQMLIEEMSYRDQQDSLNFWYTIYAIVGPYDTTWVDFFSNLIQQAQNATSTINVGVSSTLVILASFNVTLTPSATLTVNVFSVPAPSTTLFPSTSLYPG